MWPRTPKEKEVRAAHPGVQGPQGETREKSGAKTRIPGRPGASIQIQPGRVGSATAALPALVEVPTVTRTKLSHRQRQRTAEWRDRSRSTKGSQKSSKLELEEALTNFLARTSNGLRCETGMDIRFYRMMNFHIRAQGIPSRSSKAHEARGQPQRRPENIY